MILRNGTSFWLTLVEQFATGAKACTMLAKGAMPSSICRLALDAFQWTVEGEVPSEKKFVLVGAPHTSNWDFVLGMAALCVKRLNASWMGKDTLFRFPQGALFRALGGIPIERSKHHHYVDAMVREFSRRDRFVLLLSAEGTRSLSRCWRSGFYHIALGARVPICLGYLDYPRKRMGFGPLLGPTGNVKEDMDLVRAFYADKMGRHPENATPPLLMEEPRRLGDPCVEDAARCSQP